LEPFGYVFNVGLALIILSAYYLRFLSSSHFFMFQELLYDFEI